MSHATQIAQPNFDLKLQKQQYDVDATKTIVDLQPFRQETTAEDASGGRLKLITLNPNINSWFLLEVTGFGLNRSQTYHIQNIDPTGIRINLTVGPQPEMIFSGPSGSFSCAPWAGDPSPLAQARADGLPFASLCEGRIYLRNRVAGRRTNLERTSEFLRDHIWLGNKIVGLVKNTFFKDSFMESGEEILPEGTPNKPQGPGVPALSDRPVITTRIGLNLTGTTKGQMTMGNWYPVTDMPGVFASSLQPWALSPDIWKSPGKTNRLDDVEKRATAYFVAFDLSQFELGYELGTDHPRLGWSPRPPKSGVEWQMPGPDGIKSAAPVVSLGMVSPNLIKRTVATFTAGFKRQHGAFRYGDFATKNHGSHYGFIVQGVVFSKLQAGLSTLFVLDDGAVHMKTWELSDNKMLPHIKFARQNGVPLVVTDHETGTSVPGALVPSWGGGNWSGSADVKLRTLRAGTCVKDVNGTQFLIYGYFSTATPSAMARVFQSMSCDYAMLLDMNALEHTYMALYAPKDDKLQVQHLVPQMATVDKQQRGGVRLPRFTGFPDNRDFFYLTRRKESK